MATPYFDIGGVPDRPLNPPEPNISDRDLDALRNQLDQEVSADFQEPYFWRQQEKRGTPLANARDTILSLLASSYLQNGIPSGSDEYLRDACEEMEKLVQAEKDKREREALHGAD